MDAGSRWLVAWLVNSAWQISLIAAVALLGDRLLRDAAAHFRHSLWVAALALSVVLPVASLVQDAGSDARARLVRVSEVSAANTPKATSVELTPLKQDGSKRDVADLATLARATVSGVGWKASITGWLNRRHLDLSVPRWLARMLVFAYLLWLLVNGARLGRAWIRTRAILKTARRTPLPDRLQTVLERCEAALGLEKVSVLFSESARGPLTIGAWRPTILLPPNLLQFVTTDDLEAALCHEMAHIRRHDYLWNVVYQAAYLLVAFHPAAMLMRRRIEQTRELACDEMAAMCLSAPSYARSLVNLARSLSPPAGLEPGYTLGVLDAGILEDRVMRLLDKRPKVTPRVARTLMAGVVSLLLFCALLASHFSLTVSAAASAAPNETGHPDFSGIWELDAAKSQLPNPAPANLVETIRQSSSALSIGAASKDWTTAKPVAATLFALLIPEFKASTDDAESVQKYGPGSIRSRTHWDGGRLVTNWTLERDGKVLVAGQWVRSLASDGQTQKLEVNAKDPGQGKEGSATLVFSRSGSAQGSDAFASYAGTWQAAFKGKPFMTLKLKSDGEMLTGSVSNGQVQTDSDGNLTSAEAREGEQAVVGSRMKDGAVILTVKDPDSGETEEYRVKLTGEGQAELSFRDNPPPGAVIPKPLALTRVSDVPPLAKVASLPKVAPLTAVASTASVAAAGANVEGGISGTVYDPSGARVPDAVVSILDQQGSQVKMAATDQEGSFQAGPLPPGRYAIEVTKAGFAVYRRYTKVAGSVPFEYQGKQYAMADTSAHLEIVLEPGQLLESVVVTAKAGPNSHAAQAVGPKRVRVGGLVQASKLVNMVKPEYPQAARDKGVEGTVLLQAVISMEGEPLSLKVLTSPDDGLTQAAEDAVKQWRYEPTLLNGEPVEVMTTIGVRFQLER